MRHQHTKALQQVASRLLAGGLVVLLLLVSVLSASDVLHRSFHRDHAQNSNPCAACLLVKGHLETPAEAPVLAHAAAERFGAPPRLIAAETESVLLSPPGRGPPVL